MKNRGAQKGNQNAVKDETADSQLVVRCKRADKALWVKASGGKLAPWVIETLNAAAKR